VLTRDVKLRPTNQPRLGSNN